MRTSHELLYAMHTFALPTSGNVSEYFLHFHFFLVCCSGIAV